VDTHQKQYFSDDYTIDSDPMKKKLIAIEKKKE
jgi:hypothetical protein